MGAFDLPTNHVWIVNYFTGVIKTRHLCRDGVVIPLRKPRRINADCYFKTKEEAEAKAEQLRKDGFEINYVTEGFI